jgi:hypothetical protein
LLNGSLTIASTLCLPLTLQLRHHSALELYVQHTYYTRRYLLLSSFYLSLFIPFLSSLFFLVLSSSFSLPSPFLSFSHLLSFQILTCMGLLNLGSFIHFISHPGKHVKLRLFISFFYFFDFLRLITSVLCSAFYFLSVQFCFFPLHFLSSHCSEHLPIICLSFVPYHSLSLALLLSLSLTLLSHLLFFISSSFLFLFLFLPLSLSSFSQ